MRCAKYSRKLGCQIQEVKYVATNIEFYIGAETDINHSKLRIHLNQNFNVRSSNSMNYFIGFQPLYNTVYQEWINKDMYQGLQDLGHNQNQR